MVKKLVVIAGKDKGLEFPLPESGQFRIGRGNDTDTRLTDTGVSRKHCELRIDGDRLVLANLSTTTGTFVGPRKLDADHVLHSGDVIRIGETQIRFEDPDGIHEEGTIVGNLDPHELGTIAGLAVQSVTMEKVAALKTGGPLADMVGSTLGHYQLTQVLARGLHSVVFQAHDATEDRVAAVKVLQPAATRTDGEMQRLARSLKLVTELRHANIIGLYDIGKDTGYCWFAQELVEGENLAQVIQRVGLAGMLDWQHALRIAMHIARALQHLEEKRVVHRHITPRRILINNADKMTKLGGLWLARSLNASEGDAPSRVTEVLADVVYQAPEQVKNAAAGDHRAGQPGESLIAGAACRVAPPAVLLQSQRRRAVGPCERQSGRGGSEDQGAQRRGHEQRKRGPDDSDVQAPPAGQAARGDGPVRFVDRINVAVEPVIDRLTGGTDQRPCQNDAEDDGRPFARGHAAGRDDATPECPHWREPGDGFQQLQHRGGLGPVGSCRHQSVSPGCGGPSARP